RPRIPPASFTAAADACAEATDVAALSASTPSAPTPPNTITLTESSESEAPAPAPCTDPSAAPGAPASRQAERVNAPTATPATAVTSLFFRITSTCLLIEQ